VHDIDGCLGLVLKEWKIGSKNVTEDPHSKVKGEREASSWVILEGSKG
jgi:hypothetical protein